ncbi:MAG: complex I subunit 5 family protein [Halobacteriota archaeon]
MTLTAFIPILLLLIAAPLSVVVGRRTVAGRNRLLGSLMGIALVINTYFLAEALAGRFTTAVLNERAFLQLTLNAASLSIGELVLFIGFLGLIYSFRYMQENEDSTYYYPLYTLFVLFMLCMGSTFNVGAMFVFLELTAIVSTILILFSYRRRSAHAAYRYVALSMLDSVLILTGLFWQYSVTHSLMLTSLGNISSFDATGLALLYLAGFGIKAGLVPFGLIWLPPAHSEAPIPVHTLLSAVLVQVAAFNMARIYGNLAIDNLSLTYGLLWFGLISMVIGAGLALTEVWLGSKYSRFHVGRNPTHSIKRVWAFSTVSEVGYIVAIFSLGFVLLRNAQYGAALLFGFGGAMIHMYNHGFCKAQLLFDAGVGIKFAHTQDLALLGGLRKVLKTKHVTYMIGGLSLALVPGTLGVRTLQELVLNHEVPLTYVGITLATAMLSLVTIVSAWYRAFIEPPRAKVDTEYKPSKLMTVPGYVLVAVILCAGVWFTLAAFNINVIISQGAFESALQRLVESVIYPA